MQHQPKVKLPVRQQGATLVIALLILVLIMMIGIVAVSTSNTQYKLAGNLQFEDAAMNNAEAAIATAENWLVTNAKDTGFTTGTTPHLYTVGATDPIVADPLSTAWGNSNSLSVSGDAQRYLIQQLSTNNLLIGSNAVVGKPGVSVCNKVNTYLISGRGVSARGATKVVQSYYSVFSC